MMQQPMMDMSYMVPQNYMYAQTKDEINTKIPDAVKQAEKKLQSNSTKLAQMGPYDYQMMMQMQQM